MMSTVTISNLKISSSLTLPKNSNQDRQLPLPSVKFANTSVIPESM